MEIRSFTSSRLQYHPSLHQAFSISFLALVCDRCSCGSLVLEIALQRYHNSEDKFSFVDLVKCSLKKNAFQLSQGTYSPFEVVLGGFLLLLPVEAFNNANS